MIQPNALLPSQMLTTDATITPTVTPIVAAKTKNSPSPSVADSRGMSTWIPMPSPSWAKTKRSQDHATAAISVGFVATTVEIAVVNSNPANIQPNDWTRKRFASSGAGRTPSCDGRVRFCMFEASPIRVVRRSPHETRVARVPALGQQGHLDIVLDDRFRLLLDLLDHRSGVGAERGRQDHLDLGLVSAEQDLLDQGELDDVHPDLGVDHRPQGVEDRELGGAPLGVECGRSRIVCDGRISGGSGRGRGCRVGGVGLGIGHRGLRVRALDRITRLVRSPPKRSAAPRPYPLATGRSFT